jgi:hypothetical protein
LLILGSYSFTDYSLPEHVTLGGEQKLIVHKLPGGDRVIDAMGPDDSDITWHGRFQRQDATEVAVALDGARKQGKQLSLTVGSQNYNVVIKSFNWDYERAYQILYHICCTVVPQQAGNNVASLDSLVSDDLTSANSGVSGLGQ